MTSGMENGDLLLLNHLVSKTVQDTTKVTTNGQHSLPRTETSEHSSVHPCESDTRKRTTPTFNEPKSTLNQQSAGIMQLFQYI